MEDKLPFLSDDFHFAIAQVAVRSAQMEHHIEHTIGIALLKSEHIAKFLLKNMGQDRVVKGMKATLMDAFPSEHAAIEALITEIERVRSERNEILHFIWGKAPEEDRALQLSLRPYRDQITRNKSAEDVRQLAHDMLEVSRSLLHWSQLAFDKNRNA